MCMSMIEPHRVCKVTLHTRLLNNLADEHVALGGKQVAMYLDVWVCGCVCAGGEGGCVHACVWWPYVVMEKRIREQYSASKSHGYTEPCATDNVQLTSYFCACKRLGFEGLPPVHHTQHANMYILNN